MKIIDVPKSVSVKPIAGGQGEPREISFKDFCTLHLDSYAEIKTPSQVRQAAKVFDALEAGGATLSLEDADYELLKAAAAAVKYVPGVARQMVSYFDAIDKAQDVKK